MGKKTHPVCTDQNVSPCPGISQQMPEPGGDSSKRSPDLVLELGLWQRGIYRWPCPIKTGNNIIGVDIKGNRIYIGAKQALDEKLKMQLFHPDRNAYQLFCGRISEIWITFPDPQLHFRKAKKGYHPRFLRMYQQLLRKGWHPPQNRFSRSLPFLPAW